MENIFNFFTSFITGFAKFGNWFFNEKIIDIFGAGFRPYELLLFSGIIIIIGIYLVKLVI